MSLETYSEPSCQIVLQHGQGGLGPNLPMATSRACWAASTSEQEERFHQHHLRTHEQVKVCTYSVGWRHMAWPSRH
jgi:hypothetical protein